MIAGVFLMLAGGFSILGGAMNWDFYMNNRRARMVVALVGRTGARVFYIVLGAAFAILGLVVMISGPPL